MQWKQPCYCRSNHDIACNSALVIEVSTLRALFFDLHDIAFPFREKIIPNINFLSSLSFVKSESVYPICRGLSCSIIYGLSR